MAQTHEYKVIAEMIDSLQRELNEAAKEGYEVVTAFQSKSIGTHIGVILVRPAGTTAPDSRSEVPHV